MKIINKDLINVMIFTERNKAVFPCNCLMLKAFMMKTWDFET